MPRVRSVNAMGLPVIGAARMIGGRFVILMRRAALMAVLRVTLMAL